VRLDRVVLRAMERERERRYQRVDEFKTGIQRPEGDEPGAASGGAKSLRGPCRKRGDWKGDGPRRQGRVPRETRTCRGAECRRRGVGLGKVGL
jgi:hypothetical protein